jgi:hypothetical protein
MRFKSVLSLFVAFVLLSAGCGGAKKNSAATTPAAPAGTTTTAAPSLASSKNCVQLLSLGAKFAQAFSAPTGSAKANITDEAKAFEAMAAAAPSDIRGDFMTIATAFSAYAKAFAKAGIKAGTMPTAAQLAQVEGAAKSFSTPKLKAAEQHLSAWGRKNCGLKG